MNFNPQKFKTLVHYICFRCSDPAKLGATKLNKVLWLSDVAAYLYLGSPITGERYIKRQFGPVPHHLLQIVQELQAEGAIAVREPEPGGFRSRQFLALKNPDLSMFSAQEISYVDQVMEFVCHKHTARSISRASHDDIWKMATIGEELPYHAFFVSKLGEIDEQDIAWAKEKAAQLALTAA